MLGGLCGEVCVPLWGSSGGSGGRLLFRALLHVLDLTPRDASSDDIPLSMWERIILPSLHRGGEVGDLALACLRRLLHPSPPVWLSTAVIPLCFQSISLDVAAVGLPLEPACACIVALLTLQAPPPDFVMELLPLVTTFLRESNSSQRAVVSISVVQALVAFARDASRCASHLAPVICATLQQCVEGLLGNGKQAELDGYSLMCQLCTSLPGFTDTQAFW